MFIVFTFYKNDAITFLYVHIYTSIGDLYIYIYIYIKVEIAESEGMVHQVFNPFLYLVAVF